MLTLKLDGMEASPTGYAKPCVEPGASWLGHHEGGVSSLRRGRAWHYGAFITVALSLLDSLCLYCTAYLAVRLSGADWSLRYVTFALLGVVAFSALSSFRALRGGWRHGAFWRDSLAAGLQAAAAILVVQLLVVAGTDWGLDPVQRHTVIVWIGLAILGMAASRAGLHGVLRLWRFGRSTRRTVAFYGAGGTADLLAGTFRAQPWMGLEPIGTFDDVAGESVGGTLDDLVAVARGGQLGAVYVTLPLDDPRPLRAIVDRFTDTTVAVHVCPALSDLDPLGGAWDDVAGVPVLTVVDSPLDNTRRHVKRIEDLVLCGLLLPLVLPVLLGIGLAVRLTSAGPALYRQTRYGLDGRPFQILKFRTMYTTDNDAQFVQAKRDDTRITPLGRILRRTSLDELPQLLNVLRGDMSVVGPRPAPVLFNETNRVLIRRYMLRHTVKPGMTGLAQVSGLRGETETLAKIASRTACDLAYIDRWSLWLDLRILWRTIFQVVREARGA